tara:strand:+ start:551 stop:859 length:309 start_codon:yes stop_codon:yes gene_type:complete
MKVILPTDTTHTIAGIPRYYTGTTVSLETYNEATKATTTQTIVYTNDGGVMIFTFDLICSEMDRYTFTFTDVNGIVYMCKSLATVQDPSTIQLTKNSYKYVG